MTLGDIIISIGLEMKDLLDGLSDAHRAMRNFEDIVEDVGKKIKDAFVDTVSASFDMVDSIQTAQVAFSTFGDSVEVSTALLKDLEDLAVATPFTFDGIQTAATRLHAVGVQTEYLIPLINVLGDGLAAAGQKGTDSFLRLVKALGEIIAKGTLTQQRLQQFAALNINLVKLIAESMGKSEAQVTAMITKRMISAKQAITVLMDHFLKAKGAMAQFTGTLYGAFNQAKEAALLFLGKALVPVAEHLTMLLAAINGFGGGFGDFLTPAVDAFNQLIDIVVMFIQVMDALPTSTQAVIAVFGVVLMLIPVLITGFLMVTFYVSAFASAFLAMCTLIYTVGAPVILIMIVAIASLIGILIQIGLIVGMLATAWFNDWYNIQEITKSVASGIMGIVGWLADGVNSILTGMLDGFISMFTNSWRTGIIDVIADGLRQIKAPSQAILDIIDNLDTARTSLAGFDAQLNKEGWGKTVESKLGELASMTGDSLTQYLSTSKDEFLAFIKGPLKDTFESFLPDKAKKVFEDWSAGKKGAAPEGKDFSAAITAWLATLSDGLDSGPKNKVADIKDAVDTTYNIMYEASKSFTKLGNVVYDPRIAVDAATQVAIKMGASITKAGEYADEAYSRKLKETITESGVYWSNLHRTIEDSMQLMKANLSNLLDTMKDYFQHLKDIMDEKSANLTLGSSFFSGGAGKSGLDLSNLVQSGQQMSEAAGKAATMLSSDANSLGGFGKFLASMSPAMATIVGIIIDLITKTHMFTHAVKQMGQFIDMLVRMLNRMLDPLQPFINVIVQIATILVRIALQSTGIIDLIASVLSMVGYIGGALIPIMMGLQKIASRLRILGGLANLLHGVFYVAGALLFNALKAVGVVLTIIAWVLGSIHNAFAHVWIDLLKVLKHIPGLHKWAQEAIDTLKNNLVHTGDLGTQLATLTDMTFDDAMAMADHAASVDDATKAMNKMTAELLNVPEGYKIALARFNSATGDPRTIGSSSGSSGGGSATTGTGKHGGDDSGDTVQVKHQGTKPTSREKQGGGGGSGGDIYIDQVIVQANSIGDLYDELDKYGKRKSVVSSGRVYAGSNGRFTSAR